MTYCNTILTPIILLLIVNGCNEIKSPSDTNTMPIPSGCGKPPLHSSGGAQVSIDAGIAGGHQRGFYLSLPKNYNPMTRHRLIIGYAGTNWPGKKIQPYFDLENHAQNDEIFVYPDVAWHEFEDWGKLGGWLLGPYAAPADGRSDFIFTEKLIDYMQEHYCIDHHKVFATGHSWGGDMAGVVACFLGDRFRASVPIASNRPFWFEPTDNSQLNCTGSTAIWIFFGHNDTHFEHDQAFAGQYGDENRDFWLKQNQCDGVDQSIDLNIHNPGECYEYTGCQASTRYCLYADQFGHQKPSYYPAETMKFFRSFK